MRPAQKLRMGKAIADDLRKRYAFTLSGKDEATLYEALMENKSSHGQGIHAFLMWTNPLFQEYKRIDVLNLLVEKECLKQTSVTEYNEKQGKLGDMSRYLKELQELKQESPNIKEDIKKTIERIYSVEGELQAIEEEILKDIEDMWKTGKLKHTLLTHTKVKTKKKTTLARSVPLNQIYPEKTKKQVEESEEKPYSATDIMGLEQITVKQFQALQFLAHKAQNQTSDEKKLLKIWEENIGETHRGFRIVAFKESEYVTHSQGKESAIVSNKEKTACMKAIDELKDIRFTIRWEEKDKGKKEYVLYKHALIKTLNPKDPWTLVKEEKYKKEIKKFQFIAIPERLFEYQEIKDKDTKYKGAKVLFDVINMDPDFFSTLKYSDPEIKHVSDSLMRLSLMFLIEGSFNRTEFVIDEEKLLKRIGLIDQDRRKGRAIKTLDTYVNKLISHGTLEGQERIGKQRIFRIPKKPKKEENEKG